MEHLHPGGITPRRTAQIGQPGIAQHAPAHVGPAVELYIGHLSSSGPKAYSLRQGLRKIYQRQRPGVNAGTNADWFVTRFVLVRGERTDETGFSPEDSHSSDMLYVPGRVGYQFLLPKVVGMLQDAVRHFPTIKWVAKMDDDSVVLVRHMARALWHACPGGRHCPLYWGCLRSEGEVITEPKHKWAAIDYKNHTRLRHFPPYMFGAGYVLSRDVAAQLIAMDTGIGLVKHLSMEDATVGMWLLPLQVRRSSHCPRFVNTFQRDAPLTAGAARALCSGHLLVAHKVLVNEISGEFGQELARCSGDLDERHQRNTSGINERRKRVID